MTCEHTGCGFRKCGKPGLLICQHVIPNMWVESEKTYVYRPRVHRAYRCRWHIAGHNNPRRVCKLPGGKMERKTEINDDILISQWETENLSKGEMREDLGFQFKKP